MQGIVTLCIKKKEGDSSPLQKMQGIVTLCIKKKRVTPPHYKRCRE
jgi:hypothetical protein